MDKWDRRRVYLRIIAQPGATPFVSEHDCWNAGLFIETTKQTYAEIGGSAEVISQQDYQRGRGR